MRKIVLCVLAVLFTYSLFAQEQADTSLSAEDKSGIASSNALTLQITTLPEAKLGFTKRLTFPFMQGESPLTEGNNIGLAMTAELSPISLNGLADAVWTPVAFFQLAAGGRLGTGWNIALLGNDIYGIGLNQQDGGGKAELNGNAFDGLLWKAQAGAALQADAAAIFPGDWNHVVIRSYHEISHRGYSRADADDSWYFEADDGENVNGFNYYGNLLIGYQMPIFFKMAALLAEGDLYLYDTPNRAQWGDDKIRWTFSSIFQFEFTKQIGLSILTQFRTRRNYKEADWQDLYYRNRHIDTNQPLHLEFYRVAAALTYTF